MAEKKESKGKEKTKRSLVKKKSKKKFYVPNSTGKRRMKSVKPRWRKPRGVDNKKRIRKAFFGASPRIGNKNPESVRGLHPLGLPELLVNCIGDLEGAKDVLIRVASGVGKRKRADIIAKAKAMKLRILNEGVAK